MKAFIYIFALIIFATSCKKTETTYWCQTTDVNGADINPRNITMTAKEKDKYVKENTVEIDGNTSTVIAGEKYTSCDPIK